MSEVALLKNEDEDKEGRKEKMAVSKRKSAKHETHPNLKKHKRAVKPKDLDDESLVMTVPAAGKKLGLSRNGAYEAAKRGDIPTIKIGRLLKVPTVAFDRMLA